MKLFIRRFIAVSISLVSLGGVLTSGPTPALAATSITVGDDGAHCHGTVSTIQAAVTTIGINPGKITVCAGLYSGTVVVNNANKLKIIGKPGATIVAASGFTGGVISVNNSTSVTIQGMTINGQGTLGATTAYGINYFQSSGTISKNSIINWHRASYADATDLVAIRVFGNGGAVKVTGNTISDFQMRGIYFLGGGKPTITSNTLTGYGGSDSNFPIGIQIGSGGNQGGTISKNKLTSVLYGDHFFQAGILVYDSSYLKISSNTITNWFNAIWLASYGYTANGSNYNKITGNKIYETYTGVTLQSASNAANTYATHVDKNIITGNKMTNLTTSGGLGFYLYGFNEVGGPDSFITDAVIKKNTMTGFGDDVYIEAGPIVTGVFAPNTMH